MKSNKLIILAISLFLVLTSACNSFDDSDNTVDYTKWKAVNDAYFVNMKDSVGYVLYNVPAGQGGGSFYYKITTPGIQTGGNPAYNDYVVVNYRGKLINGTVFEQTYSEASPLNNSTAKPAKFMTSRLITGWTLNLMQMKAGEIRTIILPQELAYGASGVSAISPYSTLRFDIQLVSFGAN
jgi:FKBP-type peptidyl-prolyl cis-trans isomerase FklB